jgi:multisubunit Na+/H+ antiporter MnhF subunit
MNGFPDWSNFFVAAAGGSAALTGLVFVGVSISLERILKIPKISGRAVDALSFLLLVLLVSLVCLVPDQSAHAVGIEILLLSAIATVIILRADITLYRSIPEQWKGYQRYNIIVNMLIILPNVIGAVIMTLGISKGMYFIVPAFILAFVKALVDAWVLLIEIHR